MKLFFGLLMLIAILSRGITFAAEGIPSFAQPAISPDGGEIAFCCHGEIWTVPAGGGDARILISRAADESHPPYSPDGHRLAFVSTRTGNGDIYVLSLDTGKLAQLTCDDAFDELCAWSPDGTSVYFSTNGHNFGGMYDIYRVNCDGGTPMPVLAEPYTSQFTAAPNPDGHTIAFCSGGIALPVLDVS